MRKTDKPPKGEFMTEIEMRLDWLDHEQSLETEVAFAESEPEAEKRQLYLDAKNRVMDLQPHGYSNEDYALLLKDVADEIAGNPLKETDKNYVRFLVQHQAGELK